ncbi:unnamed protein product (macronuclear) [Paramecium tetraurelia]|uniref:cGMP-dependent protein kinase n=1 Tax=Paramecium tetraurelia TaxID=5888 RepID=Q3SEM1_PARTE|nr:uncharacterized protein GSPATT00027838001 [Paramecium tetraurelia]CAH69664.1 cGMP-dependent protein kinase 10-2 [Paramecium tetraurelia]CAK56806.1 unnamed protein product [Paramecium tetraurelia]|eukprot:XP_001424204.1 hypothetical protein (macronuclear) [Paramecium tetraurelia strain d4-2]
MDPKQRKKSQEEIVQIPQRKAQRVAGIQQSSGGQHIYETYVQCQKQQQRSDIIFIVMCLKLHFVFSFLNDAQLNHLASQMFYCKLQKGQSIIKQGDGANAFFILEKGKIQVFINGQAKKQLISGNGLGELALLYDAPRSATCTALEDCNLWGIDRATFRKTVEQIMKSEYERNRKYLENATFFNHLTKEQKDAIGGVLISQKFQTNQIIVNKGDQADSLFIIAEGKVGVYTDDGLLIRTLSKGEYFGENALMQDNCVRGLTVKAIEESRLLALGRETLTKILGDGVQMIIYKNQCKWILQQSKINLIIQIDQFLDLLTIRKLKKGDIIINKGQLHGELIIVIDGKVSDSNQNSVCEKGKILLDKTVESNGTHDQDYFMLEDGIIAAIDYNIVKKQFGEQQQILEVYTQQANNQVNKVKDYSLEDLNYLKTLGCGQFGMVYLCQFKNEQSLFALKIMTRANIKQFGIAKHVANERRVQSILDHPLIMRFFRSFKDDNNIYLLNEYIPGIELFDAIREIGLLNKNDSQFYISQMILQTEYLHTVHQVMYRDYKPENLMVDDTGYLKLIDFGTAKLNQPGQKTFTIIGTPHYMAPEVISGKGYNQMVDLWSVGVILYEFVCGGLPFGEDAEDPFEIYKEITKKPLSYPSYMSDKSAKIFIEQLLNRIPELRLGGSYQTLKQHAWFKDFQWDVLITKKLKPVYKPSANKIITNAQVQLMKRLPLFEQMLKDAQYFKKQQPNPKDSEWDNEF